jgi:hypothetical protein
MIWHVPSQALNPECGTQAPNSSPIAIILHSINPSPWTLGASTLLDHHYHDTISNTISNTTLRSSPWLWIALSGPFPDLAVLDGTCDLSICAGNSYAWSRRNFGWISRMLVE